MLMRARLLARAQPLLARGKDAFVRFAGGPAPSSAPPKNFLEAGQFDGGFFQVNLPGSGQQTVSSRQQAVGRGQGAAGSRQQAVGIRQWASGSGQWAAGSGGPLPCCPLCLRPAASGLLPSCLLPAATPGLLASLTLTLALARTEPALRVPSVR
jgi:hypothetical protein